MKGSRTWEGKSCCSARHSDACSRRASSAERPAGFAQCSKASSEQAQSLWGPRVPPQPQGQMPQTGQLCPGRQLEPVPTAASAPLRTHSRTEPAVPWPGAGFAAGTSLGPAMGKLAYGPGGSQSNKASGLGFPCSRHCRMDGVTSPRSKEQPPGTPLFASARPAGCSAAPGAWRWQS